MLKLLSYVINIKSKCMRFKSNDFSALIEKFYKVQSNMTFENLHNLIYTSFLGLFKFSTLFLLILYNKRRLKTLS